MDTPKTDEIWVEHRGTLAEYFEKLLEHSRQLERELAEAQNLNNLLRESHDVVTKQFQKVDAELADWENAELHVNSDHPNEAHCGCVTILRKQLAEMRQQRNTLAKTVRVYLDTERDGGILYSDALSELQEALAAVKGGSNE
jgi:hypothetical protein